MAELSRNIRDMKSILYGNSEAEPVAEACAQLTQEFFKEDTLRALITCLPKLNLEVTLTVQVWSIPPWVNLYFYFLANNYRPGKMQHKLLQICRGNKSIHGWLHLII